MLITLAAVFGYVSAQRRRLPATAGLMLGALVSAFVAVRAPELAYQTSQTDWEHPLELTGLFDNPLLERPLTLADVKHMLLGHWGTTPEQNFIYVHLNRVIRK